MKSLWKKSVRSLRLEQLENRELLSATTWENAMQADAAVAAEMSATLADAAYEPISLAALEMKEVYVNFAGEDSDANNDKVSLREAVGLAADGGTIYIAKELEGNVAFTLDSTLEISKSLTIRGEGRLTIQGSTADSVVKVNGEDITVVFSDLTITQGVESKAAATELTAMAAKGGAAYVANGSAKFENVDITGVVARSGAGVYVEADASLDFNGGSIVGAYAIATQAGDDADGHGGAVYAVDANVALKQTNIADNYASNYGGALYFAGTGDRSLTNCFVVENEANFYGGALFQASGKTTFTNATIANNVALQGGAGLHANGELVLNKSLVVGHESMGLAADITGNPSLSTDNGFLSEAYRTTGDPNQPGFVSDGEPGFDSDGNYNLAVNSQYAGYGVLEAASTVVTILDDVVNPQDGEISLREALAYAEAGATITFADSLAGKTLKLNEELVVDKAVQINGAGVVLDGQNATRILTINAQGGTVEISNLTFQNGFAGSADNVLGLFSGETGGAVYVGTDATFTNVAFKNNVAGAGGAVFVDNATATFENVVATGNAAYYGGAIAIYGEDAKAIVGGSLIAENTAYDGAVYALGGAFDISNATITNNWTTAPNAAAGISGAGATYDLALSDSIVVGNYVLHSDGAKSETVASNYLPNGSASAKNTLSTYDFGAGNLVYDANKPLFNDDYTLAVGSQALQLAKNGVQIGYHKDSDYEDPTAFGETFVVDALESDPTDGKLSFQEAIKYANMGYGSATIKFASSLAGATIDMTGLEIARANVDINAKNVVLTGKVVVNARTSFTAAKFEGAEIVANANASFSNTEFDADTKVVANATSTTFNCCWMYGSVTANSGTLGLRNVLFADDSAFNATGAVAKFYNVTFVGKASFNGGDAKFLNSIVDAKEWNLAYDAKVEAYNTLATFDAETFDDQWTYVDNPEYLVYDATKPLFADGDYHLANYSQAVDRGNAVLEVDGVNTVVTGASLDGTPRPMVTGKFDLGAYQSAWERVELIVDSMDDVTLNDDGKYTFAEALRDVKAYLENNEGWGDSATIKFAADLGTITFAELAAYDIPAGVTFDGRGRLELVKVEGVEDNPETPENETVVAKTLVLNGVNLANLTVVGDVEATGATFENVEITGDVKATDATFKDVEITGAVTATKANFNGGSITGDVEADGANFNDGSITGNVNVGAGAQKTTFKSVEFSGDADDVISVNAEVEFDDCVVKNTLEVLVSADVEFTGGKLAGYGNVTMYGGKTVFTNVNASESKSSNIFAVMGGEAVFDKLVAVGVHYDVITVCWNGKAHIKNSLISASDGRNGANGVALLQGGSAVIEYSTIWNCYDERTNVYGVNVDEGSKATIKDSIVDNVHVASEWIDPIYDAEGELVKEGRWDFLGTVDGENVLSKTDLTKDGANVNSYLPYDSNKPLFVNDVKGKDGDYTLAPYSQALRDGVDFGYADSEYDVPSLTVTTELDSSADDAEGLKDGETSLREALMSAYYGYGDGKTITVNLGGAIIELTDTLTIAQNVAITGAAILEGAVVVDADATFDGLDFANGSFTANGEVKVDNATFSNVKVKADGPRADFSDAKFVEGSAVEVANGSFVRSLFAGAETAITVLDGASANFTNVTFAKNTKDVHAPNAKVVFKNSIVAHDDANKLEAGIVEADYTLSATKLDGEKNEAYRDYIPLFVDTPDFALADRSQAVRRGEDGVDLGYVQSGMDRYTEPASTVVTILNDRVDAEDGYVSLREAIEYADATGATITFDLSVGAALKASIPNGTDVSTIVDGDTIYPTDEFYVNGKNLTIDGALAKDADGKATSVVTINGEPREIWGVGYVDGRRVFLVNGGEKFALANMKITNASGDYGYFPYGGAVCVVNAGLATFDNVDFVANYGGYKGGAVYVQGGDAKFANSTFVDNRTMHDGGAVYVVGGNATFTDVDFADNCAGVNGNQYLDMVGNGGAVYVDGGNATFTDVDFADNYAGSTGGAVYVVGAGTATFTDVAFIDNCANWGDGGAAYLATKDADFANVLFAGNDAAFNGAAISVIGNVDFTHVTVAGNKAGNNGWYETVDVYVAMGKANFANSIIANSVGGYRATFTATNTLANDEFAVGVTEIAADKPLFTDAENGDYTLAEGSQAINMGKDVGLTTDLMGNNRYDTPDLGAFEAPEYYSVDGSVVTTGADEVDSYDGVVSFREAAGENGGAQITFKVGEIKLEEALTLTKSVVGSGVVVDLNGQTLTIQADVEGVVFKNGSIVVENGAKLTNVNALEAEVIAKGDATFVNFLAKAVTVDGCKAEFVNATLVGDGNLKGAALKVGKEDGYVVLKNSIVTGGVIVEQTANYAVDENGDLQQDQENPWKYLGKVELY
ncbi:MAG: hypothetical protein IKU86_07045, partial [Thermoguttaceae bacterium]|nr:hypothetical protein [Thermoguttaceae bacterium]